MLTGLRSYVGTEFYRVLFDDMTARLAQLRAANDAAPPEEVASNQGAIREIKRILSQMTT